MYGHPRTGLGAILSAGAFVSAFVVGAVAVLAAPFPLDSGPFVRDVCFHLIAASALFYIYLSAEILLWHAVGFILFYLFFVGLVFWLDLVVEGTRGRWSWDWWPRRRRRLRRSLQIIWIANLGK